MSKVWYGNLTNRIEEGRQFCDEIKVGDGVTEYLYSDRHAYEVVEVTDQKHISIREYDHILVGEAMSNDWELVSNETNSIINLTKRGKGWYIVNKITLNDVIEADRMMNEDNDPSYLLWMAYHNFDVQKMKEDGKPQTRYIKMNISIGVANYYYDYSF